MAWVGVKGTEMGRMAWFCEDSISHAKIKNRSMHLRKGYHPKYGMAMATGYIKSYFSHRNSWTTYQGRIHAIVYTHDDTRDDQVGKRLAWKNMCGWINTSTHVCVTFQSLDLVFKDLGAVFSNVLFHLELPFHSNFRTKFHWKRSADLLAI